MTRLRLLRLALTQFRNYADLTWEPRGRIAVLHGANGSGKTNLLEAVSLLAPGRGLRGARMGDLRRRGAATAWAVAGRLDTPQGPAEIGTGSRPEAPDRRVFRLDGATPRSQAALAARVSAVWITPQMDRLFVEGASGRRRFLDRLVLALEPGHARELAAYETAMAGRNRLLAEGGADPVWLDGLEEAMARHAVAATASRRALVRRLDGLLRDGVAAPFPAARLTLADPVAERLDEGAALRAEDWLRRALATSRARDAAAGGAGLGAHRSDLAVADAAGLPAAQASTGQQKAMLVGLVLGHAALVAEARGAPPLLLLDEPAVHLDLTRREALFAALRRLPGQALLTGTDADTFASLRDAAEGLLVAGHALHLDPDFSAPEQ